MQKLLILFSIIASLLLAACSSDPVVNRLPWVYRIELQQGNVISQEELDKLRAGMTRRQVQFVLGAPMLADPFHAERWDYYYFYKPGTKGKGEAGSERVSLFFEQDRLVRIDGSMQPRLTADEPASSRQVTVNVPPQEIEEPGILTRLWRWMGFGRDDVYETADSEAGPERERDSGSQAQPRVY